MSAPVLDSRGQALARLAESSFGAPMTHSVCAPGRVNLIGEHIDYCNLAVLPMAIQLDVRIDFRLRSDARIRVANTDPAHAKVEFDAAPAIPSAGLPAR